MILAETVFQFDWQIFGNSTNLSPFSLPESAKRPLSEPFEVIVPMMMPRIAPYQFIDPGLGAAVQPSFPRPDGH